MLQSKSRRCGLCTLFQEMGVWPLCFSSSEKGVASMLYSQYRRCGFCAPVPVKKVWPLCYSPSKGGVAFGL